MNAVSWYAMTVNGWCIVAPMTPADAERLQAQAVPAPDPATIAARLGELVREMATSYAMTVNGRCVVAPMTPAEADRLQAQAVPAPDPATIAARLGELVRELAAERRPERTGT